MALKRLGSLLVEEQLITEEQLQEALVAQKTSGDPVGEALVKLGHITEESLYRFLAIQHGLEYGSLEGIDVPAALLKFITATVAWKYKSVPVSQENGTVTMATCQPDDLSLFYLPKEIKLPNEVRLKITVAPSSQVMALLQKHFPKTNGKAGGEITSAREAREARETGPAPRALDQAQVNLLESVESEMLNPGDIDLEVMSEKKDEDEDDIKDEGPIIKMCDFILADGVRKRASDIHITPYEKKIALKFRIYGSLIDFPAPPVNAKRRLATRFKIMTKTMNIIEKRRPQDGRIHLMLGRRPVDIRISTLPTRWGENIVMRIVDQQNAVLNLDDLGFEPDQLAAFKHAISQPYGMVFATGPTASGKTTTLFAALSQVNLPTRNIMTVEDPVEYRLPNIIQIQVDPNAGRTFASVLRAFLRHDPNIMLIGEIRDNETADIAVKASLTGHLVLSSLHRNDAPSSIMRLMDMGIDAVYVGSAVLCVASQRLLRKICDKCKEEITVPPEELKRVGLTPDDIKDTKFFKGKGCEECHNTGYKGRLAVYEVMPVNNAIREIIFKKVTLDQLKAAAKKSGVKNLRAAAVIKWRHGLTTLEEVLGETFE